MAKNEIYIDNVHIHIENADLLEEILARIDDLQASFDALDLSVRDFLAVQGGNVDALQAEIDRLVADDQVEDSKLEGLQARADDLRAAVDNFNPPPPPPEPTPPEPTPEPVPPVEPEPPQV